MKKGIIILLVFALAVMFVGCGGQTANFDSGTPEFKMSDSEESKVGNSERYTHEDITPDEKIKNVKMFKGEKTDDKVQYEETTKVDVHAQFISPENERESVSLTWEELKDPENGEYFEYDASAINDTSIGDDVFTESWIKSIEIPNSVTSIGKRAFYQCFFLENVILPEGLTVLEDEVFYGGDFETIELPDGIEKIGYRAFNGTSLEGIHCPDNLVYIGEEAFAFCNHLESIELNQGLKTIDRSAFSGSGLKEIQIPDSVETIGYRAFLECHSLKRVVLPNGLPALDFDMFMDCRELTDIELPDSLTEIGAGVFADCYSLTSITLPDGIRSIGHGAFLKCSELTSITYKGTNYTSKSLLTEELWKNGVEVGDNVFRESGLKD